MEKQTKILLGLGAVIAAYLILKPKKAVTSDAAVAPSEEKPQPKVTGGYACPDGTIDYDYTPNGVMSPCVGDKGGIKIVDSSRMGDLLKELKERQKGSWTSCNCFRAPCNCGGGGVNLDKFMSPQLS